MNKKALLVSLLLGLPPAAIYASQYGIKVVHNLGVAGVLGLILLLMYLIYVPAESFLYARYVKSFGGGHRYLLYNSAMFAFPFLLVFFYFSDTSGLWHAFISFAWSLLWAYLRVAYQKIAKPKK